MPLSSPAPRRHLHTRTVSCQGFRRDDGLWDIEGHIVDTKTYGYDEPFRGRRKPGDSVHDMWIRLTLDADLTIRAIEAATDDAPYGLCREAPAVFATLEGMRIGPGWRKEARRRVGGTKGCTHLLELLDPVATVAYQTVIDAPDADGHDQVSVARATGARPFFLNGCRAWAEDGPIVAQLLPQFHRPK